WDRMQWVMGPHVRWEIPYDNIEAVTLFTSWWGRSLLGIRLKDPDDWYVAPRSGWYWRYQRWLWKKAGFDVVLAPNNSAEPLERVREVCLLCIHRHRSGDRESASSPMETAVESDRRS